MLNRIWNSILYRLGKLTHSFTKPQMHSFKRNFQNQYVSGLRIGNTTFIDHRSKLFLSNHVYVGHHNFIEASNEIQIDQGCQITSFVSITSHSSHRSIRLYGSKFSEEKEHLGYEKGRIHIGAFSFVGPFSVIMPNTKIGKGCIVAAHSYVKGDFPDYSIIAGNPAKVIGDVREKDKEWLEKHPEIQQYYMK